MKERILQFTFSPLPFTALTTGVSMTIKKRLIFSFSLMITIIIVVAGVLFFQGRIQRYYLRQSVKNYSLMTATREIQYYLEKSAGAFDFYLILGDSSEKSRFLDYAKGLKQKTDDYLKQLKNFKSGRVEYESFIETVNSVDTVMAKWKNIINTYDRGYREKAISQVDENIMPYLNELKNKISEIYISKSEAFNLAEKQSISLEKTNFLISVGLSVIAIVLAAGLSIILFRSITQPLSRLKEGAEKIGAGNFNYEITLAGYNELTALAQSFNKMAKNLKKSETQIIQLDRMASLGQLAGGIAHELNNPLTGVLGQSQIMLEKLSPDDPLRETLGKITKAAERCRKITKGLLDFSRQKDYHFELTDITKIIDASLDICSSDIIASKITVIKHYGTNIPKTNVSVAHIQQVFLNIITNAIHTMKNGGMLTITVAAGLPSRNKANSNSPATDFIQISFKDTGDGISKENIEKIFTPFFTTKDPGKGTGLGLAISYGIVQRHNGKILASSEGEKKGATFTVQLPI
ncbi:MAG: HAMP domain-containing protein [Elusimicrobia bacterium]|nr:HAMP domain-containing protein [Elusimicrobiota bacterium]